MKFRRLFSIFNEQCDLNDFLCSLLEGENEDRPEWRKSLNRCFDTLKESNPKLVLEIDEDIGHVMCDYGDLFFAAGYIIGQAFQPFDMTDPETKEEIEFLRKELKTVIPFWPKDKKAPEQPGKDNSGASRQ